MKLQRGMSLFSFLITLTIFSGIFFSILQWRNQQSKSAVEIYQSFQGIQLAENQQQRQLLGLPCENSREQNGIRFHISCVGNQIIVRYPRGEIRL